MKKLVIPTLILILVAAAFIVQQKQGNPAQAQETETEVQAIDGKVSSMGEATRIVVPMTDKPPVHTAEENQRLEAG
jgi:ABC-type microcin C transport system permease subunit YejB